MAAGEGEAGLSLFVTVGIIFTILKVCGVIGWSWWWVLLPFYGPFGLGLVVITWAALVAMSSKQ